MKFKKDMVTILNSINQSSISDKFILEDILEKHNLKYRYFYSILDAHICPHIDNIYAQNDKDELIIYIVPKKIDYLNEILFAFNRNRDLSYLADYMVMNLSEIDSEVKIAIRLVDELESEDDLHEN